MAAQPPIQHPPPGSDLPKPIKQGINRLFPLLGWLTALVLLLAWYREMSGARQDRQHAEAQLRDCMATAQDQEKLRQVITLLRDPDTKAVTLRDSPEPKLMAVIWHNPVRRETMLDINSLPAPEPGRYFQCWAVVAGKAISLGMVQISGADAWQALPFTEKAESFLISSENTAKGSAAPTAVVLTGKI